MIVLGRLTAPYGVRGWLRLHPFGDDPASWRSMPQWWLATEAEAAEADWQAFTLRSLRPHGDGWLVQFAGIEDRTAAEALVGHFVGAPRAALPPVAEDEYYWADLIGLQVVNRQGVALGEVVALLETGAHSVLVVRESQPAQHGATVRRKRPPPARERLLPFVAAVVDHVDLAARQILVDWQPDW